MNRTLIVIAGVIAALSFMNYAKANTQDHECHILHAQIKATVERQLGLIEQMKKSPATDYQSIDQHLAYTRKVLGQLTIETRQKGCPL